jgi:hypothetical protein
VNYYGVDKKGRPIEIVKPSGPKLKIIYDTLTFDEFFEMQLMMYERIERIVLPLCSQKAGKKVGK